MSYFSVTSSKLRASAEELTQQNAQFKTGEEQLDAAELSLKGMWEGAANEAFHAAFTKDRGQMDAFHTEIARYIEALLVIAAKYEEAEERNIRTAATRTY